MSSRPVTLASASLPRELAAQVERAVAEQRSLEQVVRWGLMQNPARLVAEVIKQDEYTLDVILPYDDVYLVYDAT